MPRPAKAASTVAYLGPEGTFSHHVAQLRFPRGRALAPCADIRSVFERVMAGAAGIVPLVNSSGGWIDDTIEQLIQNAGRIRIEELLSLDVKLALVGKKRRPIKTIYSHFAPLKNQSAWLDAHYPGARRVGCVSTAKAATMALEDPGGAALTSRHAAKLYGLDVLRFPVGREAANVTSFVKITRGKPARESARGGRLGLVVTLRHEPGSLVSFLKPFSDAGLNLTQILSRPIHGKPGEYHFLVEIDTSKGLGVLRRALALAGRHAAETASLGHYVIVPRYQS